MSLLLTLETRKQKSNFKIGSNKISIHRFIGIMAIPVVEVSREGYKIRKVFGLKSTVHSVPLTT